VPAIDFIDHDWPGISRENWRRKLLDPRGRPIGGPNSLHRRVVTRTGGHNPPMKQAGRSTHASREVENNGREAVVPKTGRVGVGMEHEVRGAGGGAPEAIRITLSSRPSSWLPTASSGSGRKRGRTAFFGAGSAHLGDSPAPRVVGHRSVRVRRATIRPVIRGTLRHIGGRRFR